MRFAQQKERAMSGALAGIRVIDFGQYIAGPMAAMLLGDHGADVIRVDPPGGPRWNPSGNAQTSSSRTFAPASWTGSASAQPR
jgi:crotonobetainyl-CoA:carnitine CoA-transferase CaiB-like acyl-CoA transferase